MKAPAPAPAGSGLRTVPGHAGLPIVGESLEYMRRPMQWARKRYDRYGPVSWANLYGVRAVAVLGPEAVEIALRNRDKALSSAEGYEQFVGPFFRRGIMLLDFDEHLYHRRIMQAAFTRDRLVGYLDRMNPVIEGVLAGWREGDAFTVYPAVKQLTLDLATDVFAGGRLGPEAHAVDKAFMDCLQAGAAIIRKPVPGLKWAKGLAGRKLLEDTYRARIPEKRAGNGDDLLSALCHAVTETGERFGDDDVVNHMILLLVGAHDTSTTAMTAMSYYLARYPEWQERCRAESLALGKPAISFADLDALPSLGLVMKECIRLVAPLPQVGRRAVKDTELLGYHIPKGTYVFPMPHFNHHMHEYWSSPEQFDPERFADDRREDKSHTYAFAPYGGGVHKCIGMHFSSVMVKAVMHQMLLKYRWSIERGYELPWDHKSMPVPKDGLPVRLTRRSTLRATVRHINAGSGRRPRIDSQRAA
jgi:cytochrome P450